MAANKTCKYVFLDYLTGFQALSGAHCKNLVRTGQPAFPDSAGSFILPKNSKYTSIVAQATVALREEGFLTGLGGFEKRHPVCLHCKRAVGLPMLAVFFFWGYVFCVLLLLGFLFAKIASMFLKRAGFESVRRQSDTLFPLTPHDS